MSTFTPEFMKGELDPDEIAMILTAVYLELYPMRSR